MRGGEEEGEWEEEGRPGPQKLGLHKWVQENARDQAADPGSPKGPWEAPGGIDISGALRGRVVLMRIRWLSQQQAWGGP